MVSSFADFRCWSVLIRWRSWQIWSKAPFYQKGVPSWPTLKEEVWEFASFSLDSISSDPFMRILKADHALILYYLFSLQATSLLDWTTADPQLQITSTVSGYIFHLVSNAKVTLCLDSAVAAQLRMEIPESFSWYRNSVLMSCLLNHGNSCWASAGDLFQELLASTKEHY